MTDRTLGRYTLQSELGHGAMGVVYKAADPLLDRTVAIKTINLSLSKEEVEDFENRFYREAKSAGRLNHPNIVTIYDIGRTDSVAYLAMEYVEGESLRELLDANPTLPVERIAEIGAQIADGLSAAHAAEVVHRDIKPANIMITRSGQAKIMDFGVALIPSAARTQAGTILGSPKYMSPEHVIGQKVDGRSDIFSLGSVLYEMLSGRAPFVGDNISAVMYRVINDATIPPSSVRPEVPTSLDYIVAKAMAKHPDDRYATAEELARDLRNFRNVQPEIVPRDRHGTLDRRSARRPEERDGDRTVVLDGPVAAPESSAPAAPAAARRSRRFGVVAVIAGLVLVAAGAAVFLAADKSQQETAARPPTPAAPPVPAPTAKVAVESSPPQTTSGKPADAVAEPAPAPARRTTKAEAARSRAAAPAAVPEPMAKAPATGTVEFWITPWGEVYVDGRPRGTFPPQTRLELPVGKHDIEIHSAEGFPHRVKIEVKAGETLRVTRSFP